MEEKQLQLTRSKSEEEKTPDAPDAAPEE